MTAFADLRGLAVQGKLAQNLETLKGGHPEKLPGEWVMEPKFDGWRILALVGDGHVDLLARSGNSYSDRLPHVAAELLANFPPGTVLDGEAVALRVEGDKIHNEWGIAQSVLTTLGGHAAAGKVTFMVFDLIAHGGIDARPLAYANRRALLEQIFVEEDAQATLVSEGKAFGAVQLSTVMEATTANHEALVAAGFEGSVMKRSDSRYASGARGAGWLRWKPQTTVEAVVMGFKPGKEGFAGMVGAVIFGQHDPATGVLVERGKCSGMDMRTRLDMTKNPDKWLGRVIEVAHMGVDIGGNGTGRFRHPQMKRVRKDRTPESVVLHDA